MSDNKFIRPEKDSELNPVDYFNMHQSYALTFSDCKTVRVMDESTITLTNGEQFCEVCFGGVIITHDNPMRLRVGKHYSKFMLYCLFSHHGSYRQAISYIELKYLNAHLPYIRVGTDYYKVFPKTDRYGVQRNVLKPWRKDEIKQDHGAKLLSFIPLFDDFCIEPSNTRYQLNVNNCYNLYHPFAHLPAPHPCSVDDLPATHSLLTHIFGDQVSLGYTYLKVLYEYPRQPLPVLCLVSNERSTGKTTFINFLHMIFGDNYCLINPEDLSSSFNSAYATKNIIAIDETVIDKAHSVEKLKSIATAKSISVNQKFVANYSLPFFGKVIICTNKEFDFMRIDDEEIRFWVRKVPSISHINTRIEDQLRHEIPALLAYLLQLPDPDLNQSRMVFTPEQISNDALLAVKKESRSGLMKELEIYITEFFADNSNLELFYATAKDIKDKFFAHNNQLSAAYIYKTLTQEMKYQPMKMMRYTAFEPRSISNKPGKPFRFERKSFLDAEPQDVNTDEPPY